MAIPKRYKTWISVHIVNSLARFAERKPAIGTYEGFYGRRVLEMGILGRGKRRKSARIWANNIREDKKAVGAKKQDTGVRRRRTPESRRERISCLKFSQDLQIKD